MVSRRILRAVVGCVLLAGSGCSYLPYALPDIGSSVANPLHDYWFRHKLDVAADDAWRKVVDHCANGQKLSGGYAEGFHAGYVEYVEGGGDGIPPAAPPYCLRCDVLRSPDRQQLIIDYYAGYKQGADVAKFEGLRDLVVIPLGRGPQPTSVGYVVLSVNKSDPRQPDPYGPPQPLPPGFDTPPSATQTAPQVPELPAPRVAPNPPAAAPQGPALVPLPIPDVAPPKAAPPTPPAPPPPPAPVDPSKFPRLQPEPEPEKLRPEKLIPEKPMPEPQSRLRTSQSSQPSLGNGSPRPLAVAPPPYVPVPIQPPPTVVPVMAMPGEEAEPPTPRPTAPAPTPAAAPTRTTAPAVRPLEVPLPTAAPAPIPLPELPATSVPGSVILPVQAPAARPATRPVFRPFAQPAARPAARPAVQPAVQPAAHPATPLAATPQAPQAPAAEPVEGPVTGTADGLDDDDQPGETRGTTSTRDLDGLRPQAVPSSSEEDDDR